MLTIATLYFTKAKALEEWLPMIIFMGAFDLGIVITICTMIYHVVLRLAECWE